MVGFWIRLIGRSVFSLLSTAGTTPLGIAVSIAVLVVSWFITRRAHRTPLRPSIISVVIVWTVSLPYFVARQVYVEHQKFETDLKLDGESWRHPAEARDGPFGPIFAFELVQWFSEKLPKPCLVKITGADDKKEFVATLRWLIEEGARCTHPEEELRNADAPSIKPTTEPGIVIHWHDNFPEGQQIAHFFDSDDANVRVSHVMPQNSPLNLIWIEVGPGYPWKIHRE